MIISTFAFYSCATGKDYSKFRNSNYVHVSTQHWVLEKNYNALTDFCNRKGIKNKIGSYNYLDSNNDGEIESEEFKELSGIEKYNGEFIDNLVKD